MFALLVRVLGEATRTRANGRSGAAAGMTAESWRRLGLGESGLLLSLVLGALSVLGCGPGYYYSSRAFFANATREPVKVRVQELLADVDCVKARGRSAELLSHRHLFGEAVTYDVAGGEALPLELEDDDWTTSNAARCAAIVQVLGLPDQLVFWPSSGTSASTKSKLAQLDDQDFLAQSLRLEGHGEIKGLAAGKGLEVTVLPPLASGAPAVSDAPAALGWSSTVGAGVDFVLLRRETLPDGCLSLELGKGPESTWPLFLCAPDWSFPFQVGDALDIALAVLPSQTSSYGSDDTKARSLTISKPDPGIKLELWLNAVQGQLSEVGVAVGQGMAGRRTACGAYVETASVELKEPPMVLTAGDDREVLVSGKPVRLFLGRAEDVLVAPDACGPEHSSLGVRFDLLKLSLPSEESP